MVQQVKTLYKQGRQGADNLKLRLVRVTVVQWQISKYYIFWVCIVVLGTPHAMRMRYIVICGLFASTIFSHFISLQGLF
jgi:hypothetical protein